MAIPTGAGIDGDLPAAIREGAVRVNPPDADYAAFFDLLRAEGRRTVPLEGTLDAASLGEVGALLVGLPTR